MRYYVAAGFSPEAGSAKPFGLGERLKAGYGNSLKLQAGGNMQASGTRERSMAFCVPEPGEDMWLFATDWPHGDTAWLEGVQHVVNRPGLTELPKCKILSENALRLCPRLRA